ncbi:MAG: signal peptidase I [Ktedonobacteraceae bacterium]
MGQKVNIAYSTSISQRRLRWLRHLVEMLLLITLAISFIRLPLQNFHIVGHSMEPTFHDQEYVIVNKAAYLFRPPARSDVIVFHYPPDPQEDYIKRIIAVPGDVISVLDQTVIVDGIQLNETYVRKEFQGNPYPSFSKRIVGPNEYFVMGDNRAGSSDSRQWGFVPRADIVGQVQVIYWPLQVDNLGLIPDMSNVFAQLR